MPRSPMSAAPLHTPLWPLAQGHPAGRVRLRGAITARSANAGRRSSRKCSHSRHAAGRPGRRPSRRRVSSPVLPLFPGEGRPKPGVGPGRSRRRWEGAGVRVTYRATHGAPVTKHPRTDGMEIRHDRGLSRIASWSWSGAVVEWAGRPRSKWWLVAAALSSSAASRAGLTRP
jgi:hypothetical protein